MSTDTHPSGPAEQSRGFVSIEKAILLDVCLGVPLGYIWFRVPASDETEAPLGSPDTCLFRGDQLAFMKAQYEAGDADIGRAVACLSSKADGLLERAPFSVINKKGQPASGNPHDYYSLAKYWWPNPKNPYGLPFVQEDGRVNPEAYSDDYDFSELEAFTEAVLTLALAAFLTGDRRYSAQGARFLRTWFVDEATRQNPNFQHAQAVPGKKDGRWQGIIEARRLIYATESARLLEAAGGITANDVHDIQQWFSDLLQWMTDSEFGKAAAARNNNIAFWYDLQRMVYADFCGKDDLATGIARDVSIPRLQEQMQEGGSLPAELERTYPQDYVAFTVMAMALISRVGEKHGLQLWEPREADGRGFRVAHDWLLRMTRSHHLLEGLGEWNPPNASGQTEPEAAEAASALGGRQISQLMDLGVRMRGLAHIAETRRRQLAAERKAAAEKTDALVDELREAHERERRGFQDQLDAANAARDCHAEQVAGLERQLGEARQQHDQERRDLRKTHDREKRYLQAQIDAANAMWQRSVEQQDELKRELDEIREERDQARKALKSARNRAEKTSADSGSSQHEKQLKYLQAQLDTANAMWGWYAARSGDAGPSTDGSMASSGDQMASHTEGPGDITGTRQTGQKAAKRGDKRKAASSQDKRRRERVNHYKDMARYAATLEKQYAALLESRSWRTLGAARVLHRRLRGMVGARVPEHNQWPSRPEVMNLKSTRMSRDELSGRITASDIQAIRHYALALEKKILALVNSTSWKVMAPVRVTGRSYRRMILRRAVDHTRLPKRPKCF